MKKSVAHDITALEQDIQKMKEEMLAQFTLLGQEYYRCCKDSGEPELQELVNNLSDLEQRIQTAKSDIKFLHGLIVCPVCDTDNPEDSIFCGSCGYRLQKDPLPQGAVKCVKCKAVILPGQRFCGMCGEAAAELLKE